MPVLRVSAAACLPEALQPAVAWLRSGGVVAFPTDTFYGLAVDPTAEAAVDALFALKGRPAAMAVPLVAASQAQVEAVGALSTAARRLADRFWPGPLSLIVDAPSSFAPRVHGGTGTVAVRVPGHVVARALAEAWGSVVTATSANRTGQPAAREVDELAAWIDRDRVLAIDAGPTAGGAPSTIVDARRVPPSLVRAGAIAWERVLESL